MPELNPEEYEIESIPKEKVEEKRDNSYAYTENIDLSDDQKKRLSEEFFKEFDAIDKEWKEAGLVDKFNALDNQYSGNTDDNVDMQFNLHKHATKTKVDMVTRYSKKAFLEPDPIYVMSPRPESDRQGGRITCEKQSDYLDYKIDEGHIAFKAPIAKVLHNANLKGLGIAKIIHDVIIEPRRREEEYEGTPIYSINPETGEEFVESNKGLEDFLQVYPHLADSTYARQLAEGKKINIVVKYDEILYDDPKVKSVLPKNFRCRLSCEGYEGMKSTQLLTEIIEFNWWELKQWEKKGIFDNVDDLKYDHDDKGNKKETKKDKYETETFDVYENVYYFKINEEDEEETKVVCWIEKDTKKVLGCRHYPLYSVECYYVPFYCQEKNNGFIQPGIGEALTDSNIAQNAILNFTLEGAWMRNMITPITEEGSDMDVQFMDKTWTHGLPLYGKQGEVDFLQKYMSQVDVGGMLALLQTLMRSDDDVSGVSSYLSGRESAIDPDAPAKKTIALLQQSGINVEDYIDSMAKSFAEVGKIILAITFQIMKGNRKYRPRSENISGDPDMFDEISPSEMIMRTNIQTQAHAFAIDKVNEKREDTALYSLIRQEPMISRNPDAVYAIIRAMVKNWSKKWANQIDRILPPPEQFKQEQMMLATQAVANYVQAVMQQAQETGQSPQFDPEALMGIVNDFVAEQFTPPAPEVIKEREKAAKEAEKNA